MALGTPCRTSGRPHPPSTRVIKQVYRKTLRKKKNMSVVFHVGAALAALSLIASVQAQLQEPSLTLGGPASTVSFPGGVTPFTVSPFSLEMITV